MTDQPTLAERLRDERIWLGLTHDHVATALGLTAALIEAFERGERTPTDEVLAKLARLYGLTVARLQGEPLAEDPTITRRFTSAEDHYLVHRFAEYLRHAHEAGA